MIRSHKRRSQALNNDAKHQDPYVSSVDYTGSTTADTTNNPFLTASEKAIINRAALSDTEHNTNDFSKITDAISLFINKSRRLTYKISP